MAVTITTQVSFVITEDMHRWEIEKAIAEGVAKIGQELGSIPEKNSFTEPEYATYVPALNELLGEIFESWSENKAKKRSRR
jgi:hypothetical protein